MNNHNPERSYQYDAKPTNKPLRQRLIKLAIFLFVILLVTGGFFAYHFPHGSWLKSIRDIAPSGWDIAVITITYQHEYNARNDHFLNELQFEMLQDLLKGSWYRRQQDPWFERPEWIIDVNILNNDEAIASAHFHITSFGTVSRGPDFDTMSFLNPNWETELRRILEYYGD